MQNSLKLKLAFTALIMVLLCQPWQSGVYACGNIRSLCKKEWDTCAEPSTNSGMANVVEKLYIQVCCRVILGLVPSETRLPQSNGRSVTEESTEMRGDLRAFSSGTRQETIDQDSPTNSKSNAESSEVAGLCSQLLSECKTHVTATEISTYLDEYSRVTVPNVVGNDAESDSIGAQHILAFAALIMVYLRRLSQSEVCARGNIRSLCKKEWAQDILLFSELENGSEPECEADRRDSNLELHIPFSEAASEESETDVKIPFYTGTDEIESYTNLNADYTDGREGGDHCRRQHGYSSVTVPKELNFVAESYHQNALSRGEPDGQSSNGASATAPSVPTWSVVTADGYREYREYRHRYTEEWLTCHFPSSMEVMFNSSSNMNDNQTSLLDSIDSDELFGSGQG